MAKVIGIGGIFFKSPDPAALGAWYRDWLGLPVEGPYGAMLKSADMPADGATVWCPFSADTEYFAPSDRPYMFNLVVDDLDGVLARVREGGGQVIGDIKEESYGRFGWFMDPDGNKIELWQPTSD